MEGGALTARFSYSTKSVYLLGLYENYDKDFRMDTAYFQRTGLRTLAALGRYTIIPKAEGLKWIHGITPWSVIHSYNDKFTGFDDIRWRIGLDMNFSKQGYLGFEYEIIDNEYWCGETFEKDGFSSSGNIQLTNWLQLHFHLDFGKAIYYDQVNPFMGDSTNYHFASTIQPFETLSQELSYAFTSFDRESTGENIYDYIICYSRTTYQPNKHLFFRALVQYDSYRDIILSDLLVSYELVPGTVIHLGYGSLHKNQYWDNGRREWQHNTPDTQYYQTSQSLFLKGSYRLQL